MSLVSFLEELLIFLGETLCDEDSLGNWGTKILG